MNYGCRDFFKFSYQCSLYWESRCKVYVWNNYCVPAFFFIPLYCPQSKTFDRRAVARQDESSEVAHHGSCSGQQDIASMNNSVTLKQTRSYQQDCNKTKQNNLTTTKKQRRQQEQVQCAADSDKRKQERVQVDHWPV